MRTDGLPWQNIGFAYGQTVFISGVGLRTVVAFDNSSYGDGTGLIVANAPRVRGRHADRHGLRDEPLSRLRRVQLDHELDHLRLGAARPERRA